MTDVGTQIRAAREAAKLSQAELGDAIGRTSKTVRRYEQGKTTPDTTVLSRIASATAHPIEYFLPRAPETEVRTASVEYGVRTAQPTGHRSSPLVSLPFVEIEERHLVRKDRKAEVPLAVLHRFDLSTEQARLLKVPKGHYALLHRLRPSDMLILDVVPEPSPLDAYIRAGRFVDGRYVIDIGASGLQIKELTARPDGTVAVSAVDESQRFRCGPEDQSGIIIHAVVACSY